MKYIYPAVFTKDGDFYIVKFPDIEGCYTQGETLSEAVEMAEDVLCLMLYDYEEEGKKIPEPSDIKKIKVSSNDDFVSLVSCDTLEYRKFYDNKAVKKTLTIPSWLNTMSEKEGINFSSVLQNALKKELHITE
nr:MAG TPA: hypothetical protein [Caudoviricetes sp.]